MVRLTSFEKKSIKNIISKYDKDAIVYLFGSRIDDAKKGGDIDLMVFSQKLVSTDSIDIIYDLHNVIGEQKIDIVIEKTESKVFTKIAMKESVLL
jgi:uncharacterized protein